MSGESQVKELVERWQQVAARLVVTNPVTFALLLRAAEVAVATSTKDYSDISVTDFFP